MITVRVTRNLRRVSQAVFFLLSFWLVVKTTFEVDFTGDAAGEITLPYPVSLLLELDPLAALLVLLSSWTVYKGMLLSLVILMPTILVGRFFCGWVCPMGSLNHWISEFQSGRSGRRGKEKIESNRYRGYQRIKYFLLLFVLSAALLGSLIGAIFDPLCLFARSLGTVVLPALHTGLAGAADWFEKLGYPPMGRLVRSAYDGFAGLLLPFRRAHFQGVWLLGVLFALVLVLNRLHTRFWCRVLCPLGALLGFFARFSLFGLRKNESACSHCNKCMLSCQGADNPVVGERWRQAECHLCLNCQASCPEGALEFVFFPEQAGTQGNPAGTVSVDLARRHILAALGCGLVTVPLLRSGTAMVANASESRIRPPGSLAEEEFMARCIRCGQCMRVCPNNALQPAFTEAGLEGLWTPVLIPKVGYCEPTCTLCGQVCPTGAIASLSMAQKVGDKETPPARVGTAFIDKGRCLPWAMGTPCIVCEEWCPTSPKAIYLEETTVRNRAGLEVTVKRPHVDPAICTGCGACEYACPIQDKRAIRCTSVGESRSYENQFLPGVRRHG